MLTPRTRAPADLLDTRPRRGPLLLAGALIVALIGALIAGLVAVGSLLLGDRDSTEPAGPPTPVAAAPGNVPPVTGEAPVIPASIVQPLELPQPNGYEAGVPTGYPRTTAGAVAAAYGYSRIVTGLDVQATLRALEQVADPQTGWFPGERPRIADGLLAGRKTLGLGPVGPPGNASIEVNPAGYQILRETRDVVSVLTLNVVSTRAVDGTRTTGTVVLRWALDWDGDAWRAAATFLDPVDADIAHTPLSSVAAAAGWKEATGG